MHPSDCTPRAGRSGIVCQQHYEFATAAAELTLAALLLRTPDPIVPETVQIYVPQGPTVAFSARDFRAPGIAEATKIARSAGFEAVVRSPGGRMVAYDDGALIIDHIDRTSGLEAVGHQTFAENANAHRDVLRHLGLADARVGEVEGEYCPGEFSVNVAGTTKIIGSAQRVTSRGALFSTVIQVNVSDRVRAVMSAVSEALGYPLRASSIGGIGDYAPRAVPDAVAAAFANDYRVRLGLVDGPLPRAELDHAQRVQPDHNAPLPFRVDDWVRANPLPA